ncbi:MAG: pyridoxamine 5'-phosphate oxidase family protein [Caldilineaceae bacterium]|nr:pyridoxamine 5'-phosphate oxidase family protein [Caldilineaceae bacterium]
MSEFPRTDQNRIRRMPSRGAYDKATIYPIIDEALLCHVGLLRNGEPVVIPTLHARRGDEILLHGATTSQLIQYAAAGHPLCLTMTLIDGLVLARSVFHHSVNYRSAVLFGRGQRLPEAEKGEALTHFTEKLLPGRWDDARQPTPSEMKATAIVAVQIDSASAKVRTGPPNDDEEDYALPIWAGVLPIHQQFGALEADPKLTAGIPVPGYLQPYSQGE